MSLEWVSVFLGGVGLGLSVAILVVLWRVWGSTDRTEQDGRERLEILREQQARLEHLREERRVLLEELERLREQKERLQWLREGRAGLLAELRRLRSMVEEEKRAAKTPPPKSADQRPRFAAVGNRRDDGQDASGTAASKLSSVAGGEKTLGRSARPRYEEQVLKFSASPMVASRNRLLRFLTAFVARFGS